MPNITEIAEQSRHGKPNAWGEGDQKPIALNLESENIDYKRTYPNEEGVDTTYNTTYNILAAIHSGLYRSTFPIGDEREALSTWVEKLQSDNKAPKQFFTAHFVDFEAAAKLADAMQPMLDKLYADPAQTLSATEQEDFDKLQKAFTSKTVGFIVGEHYDGKNAALINYVIRNEDFDGKTPGNPRYAGKDMVDHQVAQYQDYAQNTLHEELHLVGWELNNPSTVKFFKDDGTPDLNIDVMDPYRRQGAVEGFGGRKINFDWIQSPLSTSQRMCEDLLLYSYPIKGGEGITDAQKATALEGYVNGFSQSFPEETAGRFTTATEYAEDCKSRAGQLVALGVAKTISDETLSDQFGKALDKIILPKARELCANEGGVDEKNIHPALITELRKAIEENVPEAAAQTEELLNHALEILQKEFLDTAQAVGTKMVDGIAALQEPGTKFQTDAMLKNDAEIAKGQRQLDTFKLAEQIKQFVKDPATSVIKSFQELLDKLNTLESKYTGKYEYHYIDKNDKQVDVKVTLREDVERMVKIIGDDQIWKTFAEAIQPKTPLSPIITEPSTPVQTTIRSTVSQQDINDGKTTIDKDDSNKHGHSSAVHHEPVIQKMQDEQHVTEAPKKSGGLLSRLLPKAIKNWLWKTDDKVTTKHQSESPRATNTHHNHRKTRSDGDPSPSIRPSFVAQLMNGISRNILEPIGDIASRIIGRGGNSRG